MYGELARLNRLLGGTATSLKALEKLVGTSPRRLSVLDVGTGAGDFPRALISWSRRRKLEIRVAALDASLPSCRIAREHNRGGGNDAHDAFVNGDALRLPFADRSFDVVHCALLLHHLDEPAIRVLLREMLRVARLGILVNDLRRHPIAYFGVGLLTALFSDNRLIRNDAPLSVRRGFRIEELETVLRAAGMERFVIERSWAFRFAIRIPAGEEAGA